MSTIYNSLCDDFFVEMYVNTELNLPNQRDTLLTFFERIRKHYPGMARFYRSSLGNYFLEDSDKTDNYRWVCIETDRICSGVVNPPDLELAYSQHKLILGLIPYMLSVSDLDINSLDVTFGMDFECYASHDEVIAEALFGNSAFKSFMETPGVKVIDFSPVAVFSLAEDGNTEARISVESKTNIESSEPDRSSDKAISLSLSVRQFPSGTGRFHPEKSFSNQTLLAEDLLDEKVIPYFVHPLKNVISRRRLIN